MQKRITEILIRPAVLQQEGVDLRLVSSCPSVIIAGAIEKGRRVQLNAIPGNYTHLYIAKGTLCVNAETIGEHHLIVLEKENEELIITAEKDTQLVLFSNYSVNTAF